MLRPTILSPVSLNGKNPQTEIRGPLVYFRLLIISRALELDPDSANAERMLARIAGRR